jgi:hypothetical protein
MAEIEIIKVEVPASPAIEHEEILLIVDKY